MTSSLGAARSQAGDTSTRIHRKNRRDLSSLLTYTNLHTEFRARINFSMPSRLQDSSMQKCIPRPVS